MNYFIHTLGGRYRLANNVSAVGVQTEDGSRFELTTYSNDHGIIMRGEDRLLIEPQASNAVRVVSLTNRPRRDQTYPTLSESALLAENEKMHRQLDRLRRAPSKAARHRVADEIAELEVHLTTDGYLKYTKRKGG